MNLWIRVVIIFLTFGLISVLVYQGYLNSYVPYVPLISNDDQSDFTEAPKLNTSEHQKNIKLLFTFHDVKWKMEHGKIMIQRKMKIGFNNRELLWNYTKKANDIEYMNEFKNQHRY